MSADKREVVIKIITGDKTHNGTILSKNASESTTSAITPTSATPMAIVGTIAFGMLARESVSLIKASVNFASSNVGKWTGDISASRVAQQINAGLQIAGSLGSVVSGGVSGAVAGSIVPGIGTAVGAVVGAGIALINESISWGQRGYEYQISLATDNRSVDFYKQRSGRELTNWSR